MIKYSYTLLFLFILGCNENKHTTESNDALIPVNALGGIMAVNPYVQTDLDLSAYIIGDKSQLKITGISSNYPGRCSASIVDNFNVSVTLNVPGRCDYTYIVSNEQGQQDSAQMVVVSSSSLEHVLLPNISIPVIIGSHDIIIDLSKKLGDSILGYELSNEFVIQANQGFSPGEAAKLSSQSINYQVPSSLGWNYIAYTLTKGEDVRIGHVFMSISDELNLPPKITPMVSIYPLKLKTNKSITIDLTNEAQIISDQFSYQKSSYISGENNKLIYDVTPDDCMVLCLAETAFYCKSFDYSLPFDRCDLSTAVGPVKHDGPNYAHYSRLKTWDFSIMDDSGIWQLSSVQSIGATVKPVNSNDVNNNKFTFIAAKAGKYDVSYIISDHQDGSTMGTIQFEVENELTPPYCHQDPEASDLNCLPYVSTLNGVFTAAPSQQYWNAIGYTSSTPIININEEGQYGHPGKYILLNYSQAFKWCSYLNEKAHLGRTTWGLPRNIELINFYAEQSSNLYKSNGWPTKVAYMSATLPNASSNKLTNLFDGTVSKGELNESSYASCISRSID
jgi:hypothetical protein